MMRWVFLLLPWIELFSLIQLGSRIGALQAVVYVFLTFVLGMTIIRQQGMEILGKLSAAQSGQLVPAQLLVDELALGLAGVLLMIPGLVTDTMALLVLFGPLRRRVMTALRGSAPVSGPSGDAAAGQDNRYRGNNDPLEGEFRRLDDD